jgi:hypothetical protein
MADGGMKPPQPKVGARGNIAQMFYDVKEVEKRTTP